MKKITRFIILIFLLNFFMLNAQEKLELDFVPIVYDGIIDNLNKNYVDLRGKIPDHFFFKNYPVSEDYFEKEKELYKETLKELPRLDKEFLIYLLSYENDEDFCQWIIRTNPYDSNNFDLYSILKKSKASIILIDNYLRPELIDGKLHISHYIESIKYKELKIFLKENYHLSKDEIRQNYKSFIIKF